MFPLQLSDSTGQSPSSESNIFSASQEIPRLMKLVSPKSHKSEHRDPEGCQCNETGISVI